jgi:hypothetical protein
MTDNNDELPSYYYAAYLMRHRRKIRKTNEDDISISGCLLCIVLLFLLVGVIIYAINSYTQIERENEQLKIQLKTTEEILMKFKTIEFPVEKRKEND